MDNRPYTATEWERIADEAINAPRDYFLTKGNLPSTWAKYYSGNGEGMFLMIDRATNDDLVRGKRDGTFYGLLNEASVYHPALNEVVFDFATKMCKPVLFEFRGSNRPVLARSVLEQLIGPEN